MTADGIFISYQKDDREIANALKIAFGQLIPGISIFLDHVSLEGGDEYETKIKESIGDTKLFILICSGSLKSKDMSWCYYEAGQFRAKLTDQGDQRPKERLICFTIMKHRKCWRGIRRLR